jgi:putative transposase
MDWKKLLGSITESVDEELRLRNAYLGAENRILRQQISGRMRLSESDRRVLAEIGKKLGQKALEEIATVAKSNTIFAWHRKFIDQKGDTSQPHKSVGRPRMDQEIEGLVVRMARENRSWGYDRIVGALATLGYTISDQTVGNILKRHGIPPAPERKKTVTWWEFIRFHLAVLGATDFFTNAGWTWFGLVPNLVLSWISSASGQVSATSRTRFPQIQGIRLFTCTLSVAVWGVLKSGQPLVHDREGKSCPPSAQRMDASGLHHMLGLPRPPSLTAIAAYRRPSARAASLLQLIRFDKRSRRQAANQYEGPARETCSHGDKVHGVRTPLSRRGIQPQGSVWCRERLSGLWKDDHRKAA